MEHSPGQSQRQLRVGEQIRHVIAQTLQRGHFYHPVLVEMAPNVTVSEVRVSPDLRNATAYVTTLGGERLEEVLEALNDAHGVFQKDVGQQINTRNTPKLRFIEDQSFAQADRIERLLKDVVRGRE